MRFAIFSDVHANRDALQAVLEDAKEQGATGYVCLGDIVGDHAHPHECVQIVQGLPECQVVKGEHDERASREDELTGGNPLAEEAINRTRQQLTREDKQWLRDLKMVRQVSGFTMVHATLDTPHKWGYVFNQLDAAASFSYQHTPLCFFGHTRLPRVYIHDGSVRTAPLDKLQIESGRKYFINVGSVGQPRDGDPRATYCLYAPSKGLVELRRVDCGGGAAGVMVRRLN